jgi:hypothetical protein
LTVCDLQFEEGLAAAVFRDFLIKKVTAAHLERGEVPSSSMPISRPYPITSAARSLIAVVFDAHFFAHKDRATRGTVPSLWFNYGPSIGR